MSQRESTNRMASASISAMSRRMWGAAMLRAEAYEEVEADQSANRQAFAVVLLSSVSAGVGSLSNSGGSGVIYAIAAALVGWWVWAYITYLVGTRLLPVAGTRADHGELLRTIGFSSTPGLFFILALIPPLSSLVFVLCGIWMLAGMVVAVRQALDYEGAGGTLRAVCVCAIGFPIYVLLFAFSLLLLGPWPM
ncbi:MAG: YIP1 family protein [Myxococcota bacterium]